MTEIVMILPFEDSSAADNKASYINKPGGSRIWEVTFTVGNESASCVVSHLNNLSEDNLRLAGIVQGFGKVGNRQVVHDGGGVPAGKQLLPL